MSNKLKDEVNDISMSPEMKERILQNIIGKEKKKKIKKYSLLKNSLELTAACCTLFVCAQLVKSNPELFKINNNSNAVKEDSIDYDNNSPYGIENSQSYSSSNSNTAANKFVEDQNYNQTNSLDKHYSNNEDSKLNIQNDQSNNYIYNSGNNDKEPDANENTNTAENSSSENSNMSNSNNLIPNNNNMNDIHNDDNNNSMNSSNNNNHTSDNLNNTNNDNPLGGILEGADGNEGSFGAVNPEENVCDGSPVSEFKTIEEAEQVLNFKADLIKDIDDKYEISNIIVISGDIISIDYSDKNKKFTYRESIKSGDISGDYNKYDHESTEMIDGKKVNLKGNSPNLINLATWSFREKNYSVSSESGINYEEVIDMIQNI